MTISRRRLTLIARGYLVAGALMSTVFLLVGSSFRPFIAAVATLSVIPAGLVARKTHRFPPVFTTGLAAVGALYVIEEVSSEVLGGPSVVVIADFLDLLATVSIIALAAFLLSRRRGGLTSGDLLDGLIIGVGAWLVSWILLVRPFIDEGEQSLVSLVFNGLYLPTAVPLVALAAFLLFGGGRPLPSVVGLAACLVFNVVGDVLYALDDVREFGMWTYTAADVSYILSAAVCAAALIHPSAPALVGETRTRRFEALPGRLFTTVVFQIVPVLLITTVPAATALDRTVRALSATVIVSLVALRLSTASRTQIAAQADLQRAAFTDELTDLPNKRSILETASHAIDDLWDSGRRPSLYLFDVDGFKNINDSLGHAVGDDLLIHIARRLESAAVSIGARASRLSGDEFVVFDPTPTGDADALEHAQILHGAFRDAFTTSGGRLTVTASCGVASIPSGKPTTSAELFRWADIALYRAKATGRNRIVPFDDSMSERVTNRLEIESSLRGALARRELHLFHQPIINIADGSVTGVESLIRWLRPDGTVVTPADFIPIAEETGQIDAIGAWAILEALTQLRVWIDDGVVSGETTVSVNVSPRQLADPRFTGVVREALRRSAMPPHLLWLEVTESDMADEPEVARNVLLEIRAMGVSIALDDFGTGYSSLSLLEHFPIQRIKIDRSFVRSLADASNDGALVRTIIGMGESMGVDVVAEGVETVAQLRILRQLGCAKAQGFLISHPVPPEAMRTTIGALDSLSQWPEFSNMLGDSSLRRSPESGS